MTRTPPGRHARPDWIPHGKVLNWANGGSRAAAATMIAAAVVAISLGLGAIIAVFQWPVLFQPTRTAVVQSVVATGEQIGCGKSCTCDEATIMMAVDDGEVGRESDCVDYYAVGDQVELRRHRDDPAEVYVDPVPGVWLPVAGFVIAAACGVFLLLYAATAMGWEWLTQGRGFRATHRRRR